MSAEQHAIVTAAPRGAAVQKSSEDGSAALMTLIERAALSADFDVGKLAQLLAVKEKWEATEARKAYVAAMAAFKAEPPEILKTKLVAYGNTSYHHATLADVCTAAIQGLAQHGISHRWDVEQGDRITVTCVLTHEMGHSERVSMTAPADTSGQKNAIQAIASAVTYLQRYTLLSITGLAAKDMDDDGRAAGPPVETITEQQVGDLEALIEEVHADRAKFLAWLGVESLSDLPADKYRKAVAALESKRGK